jgi:putative phosphoribosyl transferase
VFAVPRGGIPVAIEVASNLKAPLDIVIVCKIPVLYEPEAGYSAITEDGTLVLNESMLKRLNLKKTEMERQADIVRNEIMRLSMLYRKKITPSPVKGKTAIIIDDGLASGYAMLAAIQSIRNRNVAEVVVAVPVASEAAHSLIKPAVDNLICPIISHTHPFGVASFYKDWYDLSDEDVMQYLETWRTKNRAP